MIYLVSWRQFFASLVQTLAWPLTVIVVVLSFRRKIETLLGDRLKSFKAGPLEAEWADQIGLAQEAVRSERPEGEYTTEVQQFEEETPQDPQDDIEQETDPSSLTAKPSIKPDDTPRHTSKTKGDRVVGDKFIPPPRLPEDRPESARIHASEIVSASTKALESSPRASVFMASKALDAALHFVAVQSYGPDKSIEKMPTGRLSEKLFNDGLIGPGTYEAITRLRRLRNRAAHQATEIPHSDALLFLSTLDEVVHTLLHPAELFESQVAAAFSRIQVEASRTGGKIDFLAQVGTNPVSVFVKYLPGRTMTLRDIDSLARRFANGGTYALVVTNADLSPAVKRSNSADSVIFGYRVQVVTWNSSQDDEKLAEALSRSAI